MSADAPAPLKTHRGKKQARMGAGPVCPGCNSPDLDLFQPSEQEPERLLGICLNDECRQWVMYLRNPESGEWRVHTRIQAPAVRRKVAV